MMATGQNDLADIQHRLWQAEDRVAGLEREQRAHMEQIAALTAQRDRLLRYVRADEHLRRATAAMFEDAYSAWYDARQDLIAAGDITEDAPETRQNAPGRAKAWL